MALIAQNCQMEEVAQIIEIDIKEEKMDRIQNEVTESDGEIQTVQDILTKTNTRFQNNTMQSQMMKMVSRELRHRSNKAKKYNHQYYKYLQSLMLVFEKLQEQHRESPCEDNNTVEELLHIILMLSVEPIYGNRQTEVQEQEKATFRERL